MSGVTVRPAAAADETFLRAVFADEREQFALLGSDVREILLDMEYRGYVSGLRAAHPDMQRFVIAVGGVDVGCLAYDVSGGTLEILDLTIARSCRRRGIGTAVLSSVPSGPKCTTLRARNSAGRSLYSRLGFTVTEDTGTRVTLQCA